LEHLRVDSLGKQLDFLGRFWDKLEIFGCSG